jgi:hypothetical protein
MSWFKKAISEQYIKEVNNYYKERDPKTLQFPQIFGNSLRKIIPYGNKVYKNIISELEAKGYTVSGNVAYKYFTDQMGKPRMQPIKIGRAIEKELGKEKLIEFDKNRPQGDYSIILSRNPVDILKMSDHENIDSCHSEGGTYFRCALQEAKNGGAIAYLVDNKDLSDLDLSKEEIFNDKDRNIKGITPKARIRLRRFLKKDNSYDLAIPETRMSQDYGIENPLFYKTLRSYLYKAQKPLFKEERPKLNEFYLTGGTYQDTGASTLMNSFFQDEKDISNNIEILDENGNINSEAKDIIAQYDQECTEIKTTHDDSHFDFSFDIYEEDMIDDDGVNVIDISCSVNINFPLDPLYQKINGDPKDCNEELGTVFNNIVFGNTDDPYYSYMEYSQSKNAIIYFVQPQDGIPHPDDFRDFCDLFDTAKEQYNYLHHSIMQILLKHEVIRTKENYQYYNNVHTATFNNLEIKNHKIISHKFIASHVGPSITSQTNTTIAKSIEDDLKANGLFFQDVIVYPVGDYGEAFFEIDFPISNDPIIYQNILKVATFLDHNFEKYKQEAINLSNRIDENLKNMHNGLKKGRLFELNKPGTPSNV